MSTHEREQTLPEVPALGGLYANALAKSARLMVRAPGDKATTLPEVTYRVEDVRPDAERLTAYQHLLGEPGTDVLPAGFVHVTAFGLAMAVMAREDFPLPLLGMVHIANRVEQRNPIHVGEALTVRAWAEGLRAHKAGTQVDLVVEASRPDDGDPAWTGRSTYLAKGRQLPGLALLETEPREDPWGTDVGQPAAVWNLAKDTGRRYAQVSGDRNPIHLSALTAKAFGFPRAIAHGMYTAARALAAVGASRVSRAEAFTWDVTFAKPVLLPSKVALALRPDGEAVQYLGWNQKSGKRHFSGTVTPLP
ncbi:MaoC/PaaZ C-terminal domain-containing protein [Ruania alba]|uniref:MaoC like domain-containing protein n=1 Tax=Ruania alba TaxID=648782 RepID=A0A1H5KEZ6_9MICO|nr:MaoC/PaaZ C-terminal domain-containing protein [Ruania alba]SEE63037.1 MaoC like domain-containing protein [Ruania alba]